MGTDSSRITSRHFRTYSGRSSRSSLLVLVIGRGGDENDDDDEADTDEDDSSVVVAVVVGVTGNLVLEGLQSLVGIQPPSRTTARGNKRTHAGDGVASTAVVMEL